MNWFSYLQGALLGVCILVTVGAVLATTGWTVDSASLALIVWVAAPYILFYVLVLILHRNRRSVALCASACVTWLFMVAFTVVFYGSVFYEESSPKFALIGFIVLPLILSTAGAVLFLLALFIGWIVGGRGQVRDRRCCQRCGYPLVGLPEPRCPECGEPFDPSLLGDMHSRRVPPRTSR